MKHRLANRLYAKIFGYFWKPCPLCGQEFGGHEFSMEGHALVPANADSPNMGYVVCPDCATNGKAREYILKIKRIRELREQAKQAQ